jgi:hypothetical protein
VHARDPDNVRRLIGALHELDARYRDLAGRDLRPEPAALAGGAHHLLITRCGPVDVLGQIGAGDGYPQLIADSNAIPLGEYTIRVLGLAAVIRSKAAAGRDKDRAVLAILHRTLEES